MTFPPGRESPSVLGTDLHCCLLFCPSLPLSGEFYQWYCSHVFLFFSLIFPLKVLYSGIFLRTQTYSFIYFLKKSSSDSLISKDLSLSLMTCFLYVDFWGSHIPLSPDVLLLSLHVVLSQSLLFLQGHFTFSFSWSFCFAFWAFFHHSGWGTGLRNETLRRLLGSPVLVDDFVDYGGGLGSKREAATCSSECL